jgi:hypothetical protein
MTNAPHLDTPPEPALAPPTFRRAALLAAAGPAALGLGLTLRDASAAGELVRLPAVWIGVTALMVPALYIGSALAGRAPSARVVAQAVADGLTRSSVLLLGLAPGLLFLVATAGFNATASALVLAAAALGALAGLGTIHRHLFRGGGLGGRLLFLAWSAVLVGIGIQLFHQSHA